MHIGNSSLDSDQNKTVVEKYPVRPCNESDFLNMTNAGYGWANMSKVEKNSLLCPGNVTNLTMEMEGDAYIKNIKFVINQCKELPENLNRSMSNKTNNESAAAGAEGVEGQGSASGSGTQNVGDDAGAMNKSGNGSANGTIEWKCN